jgi:hypothetical protein
MVYQYQHYFVDEIGKIGDGCTAHFSDLENLQSEYLKKFESKILNHKEPYIFCSHAVEYLNRTGKGELFPYNNKIFCLFSKPAGSNKLVYDRMRNGLWSLGEQDNFTLYSTNINSLYKKEIFAKNANVDPNTIFTLDTDIFYTVEGYDYIYETIKEKLGFELPEICRKMHTQYIEYSSIIFGTVDNN